MSSTSGIFAFQDLWAFGLVPVVFLIAGYWWWKRRQKIATLRFSSTLALKGLPRTLRSRLVNLPLLLKLVAMILLLAALARPQESSVMTKRNVEGIDIMIVLDVSDSMLIEDMRPLNRMEAAKETIANFVKERVSDRIGVVVFAGESFTLVPLTLDYELLLSRISEVTTARQARIKDGTALGVALANGAGRLRESTAKSRVIVFLTDGENNSGTIDPETGLAIAKGYGLKIYSIGLGKDGPTRIPVYSMDMMGRQVKTYQPFESTVNDDLLSRMASETGGRYFRATREDSLQGVFNEINSLERTKIDENKFTRYEELFQSWVSWAFFIYLVGWLLGQTWLRRMP